MKWLKLHNEIIHDPKIRALAFEDRWHFVALLVLTNDGTLDEPADVREELVSVALGLHGTALEKCKARLMRLRLIGADWKPCNWAKRQESTDPRAAERQRRYKANLLKGKGVGVTETEVTRELRRELRTEGEGEEEREEEVPKGTVSRERRKRRPPAPVDEIVRLYRENLPDLPGVVAVTKKRKQHIETVHAGIMESDLANWRGYFQAVAQSGFLTGRVKDWRADFDFLIRPETQMKVLEGKYR